MMKIGIIISYFFIYVNSFVIYFTLLCIEFYNVYYNANTIFHSADNLYFTNIEKTIFILTTG
jgi:hypothetical protein